ncbi:cytochrome c1 [Brevundimonas subvibrioides]|uniref:Cytochrome c1 n=1 Tax=Brevundimonas subvibrioides (strain ATCC 15264 / DSM 4735 / LMG 14903 / NBRC 16000 / CB 81) TaxID=633149 RepID=D9QM60_BRESC|nr:cytochrome c1 [Brevundimonas subvibrioides]ADL01986.1 cytochrome c1 [Brevundimonas subvibrioides ATCC 15264]
MTISIRKLALAAASVAALASAGPALAEGGKLEPRSGGFSFDGPLGTFDQAQLQRGYKVYREVCSACHSMNLLSFRTLGERGGPFYDPEAASPAENRFVRALAAETQIADIDTETGDPIMRPGIAADKFPAPFPNATAAAAANGGAVPPDLSVMTKAREGGADYIYSLLSGYPETPPAGLKVNDGQYYNPYMSGDMTPFWSGDPEHVPAGGFIAMAPPLVDGQVTFDDGTANTVDQMAKDVAAYVAWASDPRATERKQTGMGVLAFLAIFAGLTYASYRKIWKGVAH